MSQTISKVKDYFKVINQSNNIIPGDLQYYFSKNSFLML